MILLAFITVHAGFGQSDETIKKQACKEVVALKVEKSSGVNPNIITDITKASFIVKKRGGCTITIENQTGYTVEVYVDKYYSSTIDAWGGSWGIVSDYATVYCLTMDRTYQWFITGKPGDYTIKNICDNEVLTFILKPENSDN
jgi:hypothetical protein